MNDHYRALERMYLQAPYNQELYDDTTIKISRGEAIVTTRVKERHFHGAGAMHGSGYFRVLDDAAFFAVNSLFDDYMVLTVSFELRLLRPVSGGIIKSVGRFKEQESSRIYIAEATVYDEDERAIASGRGRFTKSRKRVSSIPGYQI
ncbi:MAG: PaaI family thioesterase [Syntrophomonas sp.]